MSLQLVPSHTFLNGLPPSWPATNQQHYTFVSPHLFHVWCLFWTFYPLKVTLLHLFEALGTTHQTAQHHVQEDLNTQLSYSLLVSKLLCELHANVWNVCNIYCKKWTLQNCCELLFEETHTHRIAYICNSFLKSYNSKIYCPFFAKCNGMKFVKSVCMCGTVMSCKLKRVKFSVLKTHILQTNEHSVVKKYCYHF